MSMNDEQLKDKKIKELEEENLELKNKLLIAEVDIQNFEKHITFLYNQISKYNGDYQ